jgi:hypothetical protein
LSRGFPNFFYWLFWACSSASGTRAGTSRLVRFALLTVIIIVDYAAKVKCLRKVIFLTSGRAGILEKKFFPNPIFSIKITTKMTIFAP